MISMQKKLIVSSSPFLRNTAVSTRGIMGDVVLALLPSALAAVWFFGAPALVLILVAVASAVGSEWLYERLTHQKSTICCLLSTFLPMLPGGLLPSALHLRSFLLSRCLAVWARTS